ncbi:hypothetical protein Tsubulata_038883 [Turnera subulata]|uniref:Uncharacterized protein n=1 Tax=Turnera subulata TaxID=218843 RepID=A0A9Q0F661_9ROSI|nr:hypothetical protein Tsubulata_038883 [Turnera subulata]
MLFQKLHHLMPSSVCQKSRLLGRSCGGGCGTLLERHENFGALVKDLSPSVIVIWVSSFILSHDCFTLQALQELHHSLPFLTLSSQLSHLHNPILSFWVHLFLQLLLHLRHTT